MSQSPTGIADLLARMLFLRILRVQNCLNPLRASRAC